MKSIGAVVAVHAGILAVLASAEAVPLPSPLTALMVQVIPAAPPSVPAVAPPQPKPVERRPKPQPRPEPRIQPRTLASEAPAPAPVSEPQLVREATPSAPVPVSPSASEAAPVSEPRFDAGYLSNPPPVYPAMSRRLGEEGKVLLRVFVEAGGRPSQVEIKAGSGSSRLDEAALDAVWRWKFIPARRGDEAIGAWVLVPIVFNLKG